MPWRRRCSTLEKFPERRELFEDVENVRVADVVSGNWTGDDFSCVESKEEEEEEGAEEAKGSDKSIDDGRRKLTGDTAGRGGGGGGRVGGGEDVKKEVVEEMVEKRCSLVEYASSECKDSSFCSRSHWIGSEY